MTLHANPYSHLTAKQRDTHSLPVRILSERGLIQGTVLDYGCGFGRDVAFLQQQGVDAYGYDPHYFPDPPGQKFDTILCFYVLNVLLPAEQADVLMEVSRWLKPGGQAYFAVRRDIARDGFRNHYLYGKPVYQCSVQLPFTSIFRNENAEIYQYRHFNQLSLRSGCPFCRLSPKLELVAETALSYAVLDGFPVSNGHVLVVPKRHVAGFFDLPEYEQHDCLRVAGKVRILLQERFSPDGFTIGINVGLAAGQRFDHANLHLIPRYAGDVPDPAGGVRNLLKQ